MKIIKHCLNLKGYSAREIGGILSLSSDIKKHSKKYSGSLKNKTLIMLFQKTSTRTRLSFESAMTQLGGHAIFFDWRTSQFQIAEFKDEIRAAMKFGDALMFRPLKHQSLVEAAEMNEIPVINACCEKYHPCQALGDVLTMLEDGRTKTLRGKRVVYTGIANNVSNSLALAVTKVGGEMIMVTPESDQNAHDKELIKELKSTGLYSETDDFERAISDAQYIHTDTWLNMEFFDTENHCVKEEYKKEFERRKKRFMPFQINEKILKKTKAKIMHCMPCHVGYEITREAIDHPRSLIFKQAENRLHAQKGLLVKLIRG